MSDSLTVRIADRLNIQPDESEQLLRTLARLIKTQTQQNGRLRVPGLGIFDYRTDTLSFEPDPALAEAVNHAYAGLETVTLSPEEREAGLGEPHEDTSSTQAAASPPDTALEADAMEAPEKAEETDAPAAVTDGESDEETAAAESRVDETDDETPGGEGEEEQVAPGASEVDTTGTMPSEPSESGREHKASEPQQPTTSAPIATSRGTRGVARPTRERPVRHRTPRSTASREGTNSAAILWTFLILVVILAGGAVYLFTRPDDDALDPASVSAVTEEPAVVPSSGENVVLQEGTESGSESVPDTTASPPENSEITSSENAATEAEAPVSTDLATRDIDPAAGGYTIVVASRTDLDLARESVAEFRDRVSDESIPVDILKGTSDGVTRYRVGVGQFPTAEDARSALSDLRDRLPQDAWITVIRPDM